MNKLLKLLEEHILSGRDDKSGCITIGINGLDGSGKTFFAERLLETFTVNHKNTSIIHVDDFIVPDVLDRVYDSVYRGEFTSDDLDLYYHSANDMEKLLEAITTAKESSDILLVEGIFLFKPALRDLIDFKIYLDVEKDVAIDRFLARHEIVGDEVLTATAIFNEVWYASHLKYCSEAEPQKAADIVICNDFQKPRIAGYSEQLAWLSEASGSMEDIQPFAIA